MKKYSIFLVAALALGFSSCEDKSDLGIAQTNPQEPLVKADALTLTPSGVLTGGVNLETNTAESIPVVTIGEIADLPENATVELEMQLASAADYSDAVTLPVENGGVSTDAWEKACSRYYGMDPSPRDMYVRFAAYVADGAQLSRLGGMDQWYLDNTKVNVVPVDAKLGVENKYYLVAGGANAEFSHSDTHPYVDPKFSLVFEVTADNLPYEWMIAPESVVEGGSDADFYGVVSTQSATAFSGDLTLGGAKGVINEAGRYKMDINMLDKNYSISVVKAPMVDYLYTPGQANGWSFGDNMLLSNNDDNTFSGYVYVDSAFKLTAQPDWSPDNWGLDAGVLTAGGGNIEVAGKALYNVVANFENMTVSLTKITRVGVIGDYNDWSIDTDTALTPNDNFTVWSGEVVFGKTGGWKFRMNDSWDLNLGGTEDNLVQNGDNLNVNEEGTYEIVLDFSKLPYSCTVTKK